MQINKITCPVCKANDRSCLGIPLRDAIFGTMPDKALAEIRVVECRACGCIYAYPMPDFDKTLFNRMYSEGYFPEITKRWQTIRNELNPRRRFAAAQHQMTRPIKRYLDVGCGEGQALEQAKKAGYEVYAQDISALFARTVKKNTGITVDTREISKESYQSDFFDLIYIDSVLEHVQNPREFLEIITGFLSPGGALYLIVPNEKSLMNHLKNAAFRLTGKLYTAMISPFKKPYHLVGFSRKSMRFLAGALSLRVASLTCNKSYLHIDQVAYTGFKAKLPYRFARKIGGMVYWLSDLVGMGSNLEAIFIKPDA